MRPGNYPSQNNVYMLKFQDVPGNNIMIKGIATVKSAANKSSCSRCSRCSVC